MRLGGVKKPLRLDIDSRRHTFRSVIDFEFALESRTDFPVEHFSRLIKLGPVELERTARDLRRIERRALDLIERALDEPAGLSADLADMELELFSSDHQWDQIFRGLVTQDRQYDEFKRVALSAYLKYLRARQNIMQSLNEASVERESGEVSLNPGETAIFDSSMPASSQDRSNHLEALPRGARGRLRAAQSSDSILFDSFGRSVDYEVEMYTDDRLLKWRVLGMTGAIRGEDR